MSCFGYLNGKCGSVLSVTFLANEISLGGFGELQVVMDRFISGMRGRCL